MREYIFFPESAGGFMGVISLVMAAIAVLLAVSIVRRRMELPDQQAWWEPRVWWPVALFAALAVLIGYFVFGEARAVAVDRQTLEVRFRWPHPSRRIDLRDLKGVSIEMAGTEHPSPHLVIELRDGERIEGEGTNCPSCVTEARDAVNLALIGLAHDLDRR